MAVSLDEIRKAAERVAASHGLDVVDIEFTGSAKDRILRVTLEKNAEGRAQLKAAARGWARKGLPERLLEGSLTVEQLSGVTHEDCAAFSRDFGVLLDVEDLVPGADVHAGGQFSRTGSEVEPAGGVRAVCRLPGEGADV